MFWNSFLGFLSGKSHATSSHPHRVAFRVTHEELVAKRMTGQTDLGTERDLVERSATYYVHPEYKGPSDKTPDSAVAEGLMPGVRV